MKRNGMLNGWVKQLTVVGAMVAGMLPAGLFGNGGVELVLEQSADMETWTAVELTAAMITAEGKIALSELPNPVFFRLDVSDFAVDPVPKGFVLVIGGRLQAGSQLAGTAVATFLIGQYEVTWSEWQTVRTYAAANGYDIGSVGAGCADDHPVHSVSWYDVVKWCNAKSEMDSLTPVYTVSGSVYRTGQSNDVVVNWAANGYRLPQEAEWEFAARGGNQTNGYTYSGSNDLNAVGWYWDNSGGAACDLSSGRGSWPVGQKAANELV